MGSASVSGIDLVDGGFVQLELQQVIGVLVDQDHTRLSFMRQPSGSGQSRIACTGDNDGRLLLVDSCQPPISPVFLGCLLCLNKDDDHHLYIVKNITCL